MPLISIRLAYALVLFTGIFSQEVFSAPALQAADSPDLKKSKSLADQLVSIREQVVLLEQGLLEEVHSRKNAKKQIGKINQLMKLQKAEQELGQKRLSELERTVVEMETRRAILEEKIALQQQAIRKFLMAIETSSRGKSSPSIQSLHLPENEKIEAPRRRVLANLVDRGLKQIEVLHADWVDAAHLNDRIQEEKQQLAYLVQDLKEQQGILELNHQLQVDFLRKRRNEHLGQLENYQRLKSAEAQVEHLIHNFNARLELEKAEETAEEAQRQISRVEKQVALQSEFLKLKGKLSLPVLGGKIVTGFGRVFDSKSGLYIFKKGLEIMAGRNQPVRAISSGKIAYAGELAHYGQVVIIDHGEHFYSLCAHLGQISKKTSEKVSVNEAIGVTSDSNAPLYFEIRSRNVAVNPLQWVVN